MGAGEIAGEALLVKAEQCRCWHSGEVWLQKAAAVQSADHRWETTQQRFYHGIVTHQLHLDLGVRMEWNDRKANMPKKNHIVHLMHLLFIKPMCLFYISQNIDSQLILEC